MRRGPWLLLLSCACAAPRPPPPPPVVASGLPAGCEAPLGGAWALAADPGWRYLAEDDGGAVELTLVQAGAAPDAGYRPRRFREDAGAVPGAPDAGPPPPRARIALVRSPRGLAGVAGPSGGGPCEASFRTEVLACGDGGLLLRSEAVVEAPPGCPTPPGLRPGPAPLRTDRLVRP